MNQYEAIENIINSQEQQLETLRTEYHAILPKVTVTVTTEKPVARIKAKTSTETKTSIRTYLVPSRHAKSYPGVLKITAENRGFIVVNEIIRVILGCPDKRSWAYKYICGTLKSDVTNTFMVCRVIKQFYDNCLDSSEKERLKAIHDTVSKKDMSIHNFYYAAIVSNGTLENLRDMYTRHGNEHSEKLAKMCKIIKLMNDFGLPYDSLMEHRKEAMDVWLRDTYRCLLTLE